MEAEEKMRVGGWKRNRTEEDVARRGYKRREMKRMR